MKKRHIAEEILKGFDEASAYMVGQKGKARATTVYVPEEIDVKAIRSHLKMSQTEFARRFAVPLSSLRKWEQGSRQPDSATRAYLTAIERNPVMIERALLKP